MKVRTISALILALACAANASAGSFHFARQSDAYCRDLAATAKRAASARDRGEAYSSLYAINGYRPTSAHPTDFDVAHDRKVIAKAAFDSRATPDQAWTSVLHACLPSK